MTDINTIVVLTGAGLSAESGLATFRGPGGLWEGQRVEDVCTPEALRHDPALVHRFYDARRAALASVEPNAAHRALARLRQELESRELSSREAVAREHGRRTGGHPETAGRSGNHQQVVGRPGSHRGAAPVTPSGRVPAQRSKASAAPAPVTSVTAARANTPALHGGRHDERGRERCAA